VCTQVLSRAMDDDALWVLRGLGAAGQGSKRNGSLSALGLRAAAESLQSDAREHAGASPGARPADTAGTSAGEWPAAARPIMEWAASNEPLAAQAASGIRRAAENAGRTVRPSAASGLETRLGAELARPGIQSRLWSEESGAVPPAVKACIVAVL